MKNLRSIVRKIDYAQDEDTVEQNAIKAAENNDAGAFAKESEEITMVNCCVARIAAYWLDECEKITYNT